MATPNGFENNLEAAQSTDNLELGDHVVQEGYELGGDKAIMDILSANELLVCKYKDQLCTHFSTVLEGLPENLQKSFIDSIRVFDDKNDVVYQGMVAKYDSRVSTGVGNGLSDGMPS